MLKTTLPVLALALLGTPAQAAFTSAYTDLDLNQCMVLEADDFGASWSCPGHRGFPLMVMEGDLRFSLGYGFNIDDEPFQFQTLPPFNRLGDTLEWRLSNASGRWLPIATIVRYFTADVETGEDRGQVLVVTQIVEGNTCHVAYVDALANSDPNELARAAADRSGSFDCNSDEVEIVGDFTAY
jgi:hypothetical protein